MRKNNVRDRKPVWPKIVIAACFSFIIIVPVLETSARIFTDDKESASLVTIRNVSGLDVRFERVLINGEIVWEDPDIVIISKKHLAKPWLDPRNDKIAIWFHAPKKVVDIRLSTLNDNQERDVACGALDNRSRPCSFEIFYHTGKLFGCACERFQGY